MVWIFNLLITNILNISDANSPNLDFHSNMTLAAWVNADGTASGHVFTKWDAPAGKRQYRMRHYSGSAAFDVSTNGTAFVTNEVASGTGSFQYNVGVFDSSGSIASIYANDGTTPGTVSLGAGSLFDSGEQTTMGATSTPDGWENSNLDEIMLIDAARNNDWVITTYNNQNAPDTFSTPSELATLFERAISDSMALSSANDRAYAAARANADSIAISDVVDRVYSGVRTNADSIALSDAVDRVYSGVRDIADVVALTDSIGYSFIKSRALADEVAISDSFPVAVMVLSRDLAESIGITDSMFRVGSYDRGLSDILALSDTQTKQMELVRYLSENMALTDSLTSAGVDTTSDLLMIVSIETIVPEGDSIESNTPTLYDVNDL